MAKQPTTAAAATGEAAKANTGEAAKAKKPTVCKKVYVTPDGEGQHYSPEAVGHEFRFGNGKTIAVDVTKFPTNIQTAFMWHGMSQKLGDAYAGSPDESISDKIEKFETLLERLMDGEWTKGREGASGPRTSLIFEAVVNVLTAKGDEPDDDRKAEIREKLKDNDTRKRTLANAAYKAEYDKLQADRAAERAKASAAKAKAADDDEADEAPDF